MKGLSRAARALIFLLIAVSILIPIVSPISYAVTLTLEENGQIVWTPIIEVEGDGTAVLKVPSALYDVILYWYVGENYTTPFTLALSNEVPVSLRVESVQPSLTVSFRILSLGDIDGDGRCNYIDLYFFSRAWLSEAGGEYYNYLADFDLSNRIDFRDLALFARNWLQ